jgi:uncharacterized protein
MSAGRRIVIDTNVVVSGIILPGFSAARALLQAQGGIVLASDATIAELQEVIIRPRFDRYIAREVRLKLAEEYAQKCRKVAITAPIRACRDPKDDKFLELAVHGRAELIVTGDEDLLALHPFRGVEILTPADYLNRK